MREIDDDLQPRIQTKKVVKEDLSLDKMIYH